MPNRLIRLLFSPKISAIVVTFIVFIDVIPRIFISEALETTSTLSTSTPLLLENRCLACIRNVSTQLGVDVQKRCGEGYYCGQYQLSYTYWAEAGKPGNNHGSKDYEKCAKDRNCSEQAVKAYFKKFKRDCNNDGLIDCLDMAALHKGGPTSCAADWFYKSRYWQAFNKTDCVTNRDSAEIQQQLKSTNFQLNDPNEALGATNPGKVLKNQTLTSECLDCICDAVSGCNTSVNNCGSSTVCGPFAISQAYWKDGKKPGASWTACARTKECSSVTMKNYMEKHKRDCNGDGYITCDDYAAIHRRGARACSNKDLLKDHYWNKYLLCRANQLPVKDVNMVKVGTESPSSAEDVLNLVNQQQQNALASRGDVGSNQNPALIPQTTTETSNTISINSVASSLSLAIQENVSYQNNRHRFNAHHQQHKPATSNPNNNNNHMVNQQPTLQTTETSKVEFTTPQSRTHSYDTPASSTLGHSSTSPAVEKTTTQSPNVLDYDDVPIILVKQPSPHIPHSPVTIMTTTSPPMTTIQHTTTTQKSYSTLASTQVSTPKINPTITNENNQMYPLDSKPLQTHFFDQPGAGQFSNNNQNAQPSISASIQVPDNPMSQNVANHAVPAFSPLDHSGSVGGVSDEMDFSVPDFPFSSSSSSSSHHSSAQDSLNGGGMRTPSSFDKVVIGIVGNPEFAKSYPPVPDISSTNQQSHEHQQDETNVAPFSSNNNHNQLSSKSQQKINTNHSRPPLHSNSKQHSLLSPMIESSTNQQHPRIPTMNGSAKIALASQESRVKGSNDQNAQQQQKQDTPNQQQQMSSDVAQQPNQSTNIAPIFGLETMNISSLFEKGGSLSGLNESSRIASECLECICDASSNCDTTVQCISKQREKNRCGLYMISWVQYQESDISLTSYMSLPSGVSEELADEKLYYECTTDRNCAEKLIHLYIEKHQKDCNNDGKIDCYDIAAIHRVGPDSCNSSKFLSSQYWKDFSICYASDRLTTNPVTTTTTSMTKKEGA